MNQRSLIELAASLARPFAAEHAAVAANTWVALGAEDGAELTDLLPRR